MHHFVVYSIVPIDCKNNFFLIQIAFFLGYPGPKSEPQKNFVVMFSSLTFWTPITLKNANETRHGISDSVGLRSYHVAFYLQESGFLFCILYWFSRMIPLKFSHVHERMCGKLANNHVHKSTPSFSAPLYATKCLWLCFSFNGTVNRLLYN